MRAFFIFV